MKLIERSQSDSLPLDSEHRDEMSAEKAAAALLVANRISAMIAQRGISTSEPASTVSKSSEPETLTPAQRAAAIASRLKTAPADATQPVSSTVPAAHSHSSEIDINSVVHRHRLTSRSTHDEVFQRCGAAVTVRGRYIAPNELPNPHQPVDRPLYLKLAAPTLDQLHMAELMIRNIIETDSKVGNVNAQKSIAVQHNVPTMHSSHHMQTAGPSIPFYSMQSAHRFSSPFVISPAPDGPLCSRILVGIDPFCCGSFDIFNSLLGPEDMHLKNIEQATRSKVYIRGRGTSFDSHECLHMLVICQHADQLDQSQTMVETLIQNIVDEYLAFMMQPSNFNCQPPDFSLSSCQLIVPAFARSVDVEIEPIKINQSNGRRSRSRSPFRTAEIQSASAKSNEDSAPNDDPRHTDRSLSKLPSSLFSYESDDESSEACLNNAASVTQTDPPTLISIKPLPAAAALRASTEHRRAQAERLAQNSLAIEQARKRVAAANASKMGQTSNSTSDQTSVSSPAALPFWAVPKSPPHR